MSIFRKSLPEDDSIELSLRDEHIRDIWRNNDSIARPRSASTSMLQPGGGNNMRFRTNTWMNGKMDSVADFDSAYSIATSSLPSPFSVSSNYTTFNWEIAKCNFCHKITIPPHNKNSCPVFANLAPCARCGASGVENHTITYCPLKEKVELQLTNEFKMFRTFEQREAFRDLKRRLLANMDPQAQRQLLRDEVDFNNTIRKLENFSFH